MKRKSRKASLKRKHEFRFHNVFVKTDNGQNIKIAHPGYIFLERGNLYVYVSLTHSKDVKNKETVQLRKNPNPNDKTQAYYIPEPLEDTKDRFGRRHDEWKIHPLDDLDIQNLYKKTKKK